MSGPEAVAGLPQLPTREPPLRPATASHASTGVASRIPKTALLPQYIYEFHKGVRRLFMLTMNQHEARAVCGRLAREAMMAVHVHEVGSAKVNVFFGQPAYVKVVRQVVRRPLCALTPEEDFIVGTLLGYDREQQCERLLERIEARSRTQPVPAG